jgi:hypothetical protein
MHDFTRYLVGFAALAVLGIVLLVHDLREDIRHRAMSGRGPQHPLRDWWLRHRH